jgi:hypothetical protein
MVHVVQLTSLARVARRCVRAVRDSTFQAINATNIINSCINFTLVRYIFMHKQ